ncbi:MAG: uridine kinase [Oscillospiraceae bacterium]|nr:uridine kinase [Oscillospiraceae bacterium]
MSEEYASYFPVLSSVWHLLSEKETAVISIDGRCGSGKTMLSALFARVFPCNVLHIDDYYLPLAQRIPDWAETPCANMDLERFLQEAVLPAREGKTVVYRPYSCQRGEYLPARVMPPRPLTVVEGSYSQHPSLAGSYDRKIFLTCRKDEQRRRLQAREGEYFSMFENRWIPLEERYLSRYAIEEKATIRMDTSTFFLHETE